MLRGQAKRGSYRPVGNLGGVGQFGPYKLGIKISSNRHVHNVRLQAVSSRQIECILHAQQRALTAHAIAARHP